MNNKSLKAQVDKGNAHKKEIPEEFGLLGYPHT